MRLFLAIDPPEGARGELEGELAKVRRRLVAWDETVRWTAAPSVHLTLRFLGETPPSRLATLTAALGTALPGPPFDVEVDGAGAFSSRGVVRTVWLSFGAGRERLGAVYDEVSRRLRAGGWPDEGRPFAPHMTIGRMREGRGRPAAGLVEAVAALEVGPIRWRVDRVVLFSSDLSGPHPVYASMHQVAIGDRG